MVKIYLSSTYEDLKTYRERVSLALRRMRQQVIAMEEYVATGQYLPLNECLADVADCDLYIGIFAWRYGYIPVEGNPGSKSITELEYRKACETGKPSFIFLLSEEANWSRKFMDEVTGEGEQGKRITSLRQELCQKKMVSFFNTPDDLACSVTTSIYKWNENQSKQPNQMSWDQAEFSEQFDLLEPPLIESIKKNIKLLEELFKNDQIPSDLLEQFKILKRQAASTTIALKSLKNEAQELINRTHQILKLQLSEMDLLRDSKGDKRHFLQEIEASYRESLEMEVTSYTRSFETETEIEFKLQQYEGLLELSKGLKAGKEASEWLDKHREVLVRRVMESSSVLHLSNSGSDEQIDDFQWIIQKYLKRVSFCLLWGRSKLLSKDEIDLSETFPHSIYQEAFRLIRDTIQNCPPNLSSTAVTQLIRYIEYLIDNLSEENV